MKKNILLTGASRGLGLSITEKLLSSGHSVFALNRSVTDELNALGSDFPGQLTILPFDLEASAEISSFFKEHIGFDIPLHGFINNAAMAYDDIITNMNLSELEKMFRVNGFTPMLLTKLVLFLLHSR